jgi:hypothetical protein
MSNIYNILPQVWDKLKLVIFRSTDSTCYVVSCLLFRNKSLHQINHLLPLRTISFHKPIPKSLHKSPIRNFRLGPTKPTQDLSQIPSQSLTRIFLPNRIEILLRKPDSVSHLAFRNLDTKQLCDNTSIAVCYFCLFVYATCQPQYLRRRE